MDEARLCGSSLPTGPIALPALGRSRPGPKNPTWLWWDSNPRPSDPQSDALTTALRGPVIICSLFAGISNSDWWHRPQWKPECQHHPRFLWAVTNKMRSSGMLFFHSFHLFFFCLLVRPFSECYSTCVTRFLFLCFWWSALCWPAGGLVRCVGVSNFQHCNFLRHCRCDEASCDGM